MQQVDHVFKLVLNSKQKLKLKKIIVSNNGSVLDEVTFPKQALLYFISRMEYHCPNVSLLTIETRAEYALVSEFESIERALKKGKRTIALELAVGVEVFNNKIRNRIYKKGLSNKTFERFAAKVASFNYQLKTYFMLKPVPDMSDEEAVTDIINAVVYLDSISERYNLKINLHLNMTYVSTGTKLMEAFEKNQYSLASLSLVPKAILAAENTRLTVYLGLYDEGLAIEDGHFEKVGNLQLIKMLHQFNQTQDYGLLKKWLEKHEREDSK
jgi:radical SAM enzyme (TIGR01210 family)